MPYVAPKHRAALQDNPLYESIKVEVEDYLDQIRPLFEDKKLTFLEANHLARVSFRLCNEIVAEVDASSEDKRTLLIELALATWEDMGRPLKLVPDFKLVPDWAEEKFEEKVLDPMLGSVIKFAVGTMYDYLAERDESDPVGGSTPENTR